ncbi:phosphoenolpyruvate carboxylase [Marilutibacter alkalisoli]|uniref:Phosphoenolpyruvate carboxylase n=1 Tax=Marilutibacter alkalisoli TaxID=2591633 RepID=A0A514BNF3_9GAMM|nr:phosphoenolpyruvate carboxylase [Lysobacter alkalisoli]QDH68916.1 phosphoenolpyruvate carboxylase [Lysobacter alkalisoli]
MKSSAIFVAGVPPKAVGIEDARLQALVATVNGISAGIQNTG